MRGKTLRPFITHGGHGVGSSPDVLASHTQGARMEQVDTGIHAKRWSRRRR